MTAFSEKHSKKAAARQAARGARQSAHRKIAAERVAAVHVLADGRELLELKPVSIPGYTYSF
jgi:hypothetical protein